MYLAGIVGVGDILAGGCGCPVPCLAGIIGTGVALGTYVGLCDGMIGVGVTLGTYVGF